MTEVNASALYNIYIKPNTDFKLLQCFFFKYLELVHAMVN